MFILVIWGCDNDQNTEKQRFLIKGNNKLADQQYRDAHRYYIEAIRLDSCYLEALNNLGTSYYKQGKYETALKYYDCLLYTSPSPRDA